MEKNVNLLNFQEKVLDTQANDKKKFSENIVELHPLLKEFRRFIDPQKTEQLERLIKIFEEYDVRNF
jgi:hypothetical protein